MSWAQRHVVSAEADTTKCRLFAVALSHKHLHTSSHDEGDRGFCGPPRAAFLFPFFPNYIELIFRKHMVPSQSNTGYVCEDSQGYAVYAWHRQKSRYVVMAHSENLSSLLEFVKTVPFDEVLPTLPQPLITKDPKAKGLGGDDLDMFYASLELERKSGLPAIYAESAAHKMDEVPPVIFWVPQSHQTVMFSSGRDFKFVPTRMVSLEDGLAGNSGTVAKGL